MSVLLVLFVILMVPVIIAAVVSLPSLIVAWIWTGLVGPFAAQVSGNPAWDSPTFWQVFGISFLLMWFLGLIFGGRSAYQSVTVTNQRGVF